MARLAGATQDEVRRHNLAALVRHVHERGAASRSELALVTGLNRSTIRGLTAELEAAGLVTEAAPVASGGAGRPSIVVRPRSERLHVVAVDVAVDRIVVARVGLGGAVLDRREVAKERGDHAVEVVVGEVSRLIRKVQASAPADARLLGIGVAVCGVVRHADGTVRFAPNLGWVDVPLAPALQARTGLGVPVVVGNDADLGALAESTRGVAADSADAIFLSGEVGLGAGILIDGRPLAGHGGYGGEVGHMVVNPDGRRCRCGSVGCWETEVGEDALLELADRAGGGRPAVTEVVEAALAGEERATHAVTQVGRWLGLGIGNLVNIFNPEVVVFGGVLREVFPVAEDAVRSALATTALLAPRDQVRLALPGLEGDSTLLGAAELAFAPLLDDPRGTLEGKMGAA